MPLDAATPDLPVPLRPSLPRVATEAAAFALTLSQHLLTASSPRDLVDDRLAAMRDAFAVWSCLTRRMLTLEELAPASVSAGYQADACLQDALTRIEEARRVAA